MFPLPCPVPLPQVFLDFALEGGQSSDEDIYLSVWRMPMFREQGKKESQRRTDWGIRLLSCH